MRKPHNGGVLLSQRTSVSEVLGVVDPPRLVRETALEKVRRAIITGQLRPGTRLIERELCDAMGVSRASIREVLRQLESEQLIETGPRRGPTVAMLDRKLAREIYELREMLEVQLIRSFTAAATDEQVAQLRTIFDELVEIAQNMNLADLVEIMLRFNRHIVSTVNHRVFGDILEHVHARISWLRMTSMSKAGRVQASLAEIEAIVAGVEARDTEAAARSVRIYVSNARDAALDQLPE